MVKLITSLCLLLMSAAGLCQELQLDTLERYTARCCYSSWDDKFPLLKRGSSANYFWGHPELRSFIERDSCFRSLKAAKKQASTCTRLELHDQTQLRYCKGIEKAKNLEYLNLSSVMTERWGNYIREIPRGVYELRKLRVLVADNSNLKLISNGIGNLSKLEFLSLSSGDVREIPKELGALSKLVALDLSYNELTILPDCLSRLKNLKYLNLAGNALKYVDPNVFMSLKNLEFLSIQFSGDASSVNETIEALSQLPNLKVLHVRYSGLDHMPTTTGGFKSLEQLSLRGNYGIDLPLTFETLAQIASLRVLDLSFSRIEELPSEIGLLKQVETIYLGNWEWCCPRMDFYGTKPYNYVRSLPESVRGLDNLKHLYLWTWRVSDSEKESMQKLIPDVHIEFEVKDLLRK